MASPWCFDICNQVRKKILLKDLIAEALLEIKKEDVFISDKSEASTNPRLEIGKVTKCKYSKVILCLTFL